MRIVNEESGLKTVFFGGDQLTEERARNVQMARSDGRTNEERLEGLWPKNEDWHAIRIAYDVDMYYLANPKIFNADTLYKKLLKRNPPGSNNMVYMHVYKP